MSCGLQIILTMKLSQQSEKSLQKKTKFYWEISLFVLYRYNTNNLVIKNMVTSHLRVRMILNNTSTFPYSSENKQIQGSVWAQNKNSPCGRQGALIFATGK